MVDDKAVTIGLLDGKVKKSRFSRRNVLVGLILAMIIAAVFFLYSNEKIAESAVGEDAVGSTWNSLLNSGLELMKTHAREAEIKRDNPLTSLMQRGLDLMDGESENQVADTAQEPEKEEKEQALSADVDWDLSGGQAVPKYELHTGKASPAQLATSGQTIVIVQSRGENDNKAQDVWEVPTTQDPCNETEPVVDPPPPEATDCPNGTIYDQETQFKDPVYCDICTCRPKSCTHHNGPTTTMSALDVNDTSPETTEAVNTTQPVDCVCPKPTASSYYYVTDAPLEPEYEPLTHLVHVSGEITKHLSGPCAPGYVYMEGDIPGKGSAELEPHARNIGNAKDCAQFCTINDMCQSYQWSEHVTACSPNIESQPTTDKTAGDFIFCSKNQGADDDDMDAPITPVVHHIISSPSRSEHRTEIHIDADQRQRNQDYEAYPPYKNPPPVDLGPIMKHLKENNVDPKQVQVVHVTHDDGQPRVVQEIVPAGYGQPRHVVTNVITPKPPQPPVKHVIHHVVDPPERKVVTQVVRDPAQQRIVVHELPPEPQVVNHIIHEQAPPEIVHRVVHEKQPTKVIHVVEKQQAPPPVTIHQMKDSSSQVHVIHSGENSQVHVVHADQDSQVHVVHADQDSQVHVIHADQDSGRSVHVIHSDNDSGKTVHVIHSDDENAGKTVHVIHSDDDTPGKTVHVIHSDDNPSGKTVHVIHSDDDEPSKTVHMVHVNPDSAPVKVTHMLNGDQSDPIKVTHVIHADPTQTKVTHRIEAPGHGTVVMGQDSSPMQILQASQSEPMQILQASQSGPMQPAFGQNPNEAGPELMPDMMQMMQSAAQMMQPGMMQQGAMGPELMQQEGGMQPRVIRVIQPVLGQVPEPMLMADDCEQLARSAGHDGPGGTAEAALAACQQRKIDSEVEQPQNSKPMGPEAAVSNEVGH